MFSLLLVIWHHLAINITLTTVSAWECRGLTLLWMHCFTFASTGVMLTKLQQLNVYICYQDCQKQSYECCAPWHIRKSVIPDLYNTLFLLFSHCFALAYFNLSASDDPRDNLGPSREAQEVFCKCLSKTILYQMLPFRIQYAKIQKS